MSKLSDWLAKFAAFGLVAMAVIVGWQVIGRFILANSPSWTEQAALILMIWYVLFAAAAGVYEGFHIRIALLEQFVPSTARRIRLAIHTIVIGLGLVLCLYGAELAWAVRGHTIPSLGISRGFAYIPLPVSGGLMALFAAQHALAEMRGTPADKGEG